MEIRTYNSEGLNALIRSAAFRTMPVIPISTHRALSHIHNPRADKEDILMIIAYEGEEMIGYLGVLADRLYNGKDEPFKCGWLSCMWVNPVLRGKGIAKQLLATAFKAWNDHILVTEFTPEAKGLYDRSGNFNDLRTNEGLRCYRRFNLHEVLPKKNERYKAYTPLLKAADAVANLAIDMRLSWLQTKPVASVMFEQVNEADGPLNEYIRSRQQQQFERRDNADLEWIVNYPWLKQSAPTDESKRYHFSSVADRFVNLRFKMIDKGEVKGFLHFTSRDNHLKIPYAYFEPEYLHEVIQQVYRVMEQYELNMLTVFHKDIVQFLHENPTPFIYKRAIKRKYIITKALDGNFPDRDKLNFQDGDADCAFT